ncbi:hypothetical protein Tco_0697751 [Tanacetum coccineum]
MLLVQLQEAGIQLSKEQLAILADIGERVDSGPSAFKVITNALFQSDGIELYDSDCEGHMDGQCTQPKRKQDDSWFKDKVLLVQSQANAKGQAT